MNVDTTVYFESIPPSHNLLAQQMYINYYFRVYNVSVLIFKQHLHTNSIAQLYYKITEQYIWDLHLVETKGFGDKRAGEGPKY